MRPTQRQTTNRSLIGFVLFTRLVYTVLYAQRLILTSVYASPVFPPSFWLMIIFAIPFRYILISSSSYYAIHPKLS